jgi:hypothetical protein
MGKIMEMLRNEGREFVCVGYIEKTSFGNTECSSFCLHSVVLVSVDYWLFLNGSPYEMIRKWRLAQF